MPYLCRNKIYERLDPFKDAKKIYIFCEGEKTEVSYFNFFQGLASNIDIVSVPNINGKSDPEKLIENAERYFYEDKNNNIKPKFTFFVEQKDEVWFVIGW
ncbi:hypothetical protein EZS27_023566 [termite gut metagenome]|uniref:RloB domain-containing protein n=1 Tax=termite gut metagenome TaxID=433724 RepID=A0A5J4R133_9ZZZZ